MDECIHRLDPATCTICNGRYRRERHQVVEWSRPFTARYDGQCDACDLPIHAGEYIVYRADHGRARHLTCWKAVKVSGILSS